MKLFIVTLVLLLVLLSGVLPNQIKKSYYFCLALFLGIIAYFIYPNSSLDLKYWFDNMFAVRNYDIGYFFQTDLFRQVPVFALFLFWVSKTGIYGLLQGTSVFITYLSVFLMIRQESKKQHFSKFVELSLMLAAMMILNYVTAVSGMRISLASSIFIYFLYNDLRNNKSFLKCIPFYVVACLVHNSIMLLLVFRFLIFLYQKNSFFKNLIRVLLLTWTLLKELLIFVMDNINIYYFQITAYKLQSYTNELMETIANVRLYTFVALTLLVILIIIYLKYKKIIKNNSKNFLSCGDNYNAYIEILIFFLIGSIFEYNIFTRYVEILFKMMIVIIGNLFLCVQPNFSLKKLNIYYIILIVEAILYFIFYYFGQLNLIYF